MDFCLYMGMLCAFVVRLICINSYNNTIVYFTMFGSKDIANFHRPKAVWYPHINEVAIIEQEKLPTQGPMKIILKSLGGKGTKLHVDTQETACSVKVKASKKLGLFTKFDLLYIH